MAAPSESVARSAPNPANPPQPSARTATETQRSRGIGALAVRLGLPADMRIPAGICAILSGVMTWANVGFIDGFFLRWLTGFFGALPIMLLGMMLMRRYDKLLLRWLPHVSELGRRFVRALMMTLTLETLMTSVVTLSNIGWASGFFQAWLIAFTRSLPVGLCIGLLMSFVISPRLQRRQQADAVSLQLQDD